MYEDDVADSHVEIDGQDYYFEILDDDNGKVLENPENLDEDNENKGLDAVENMFDVKVKKVNVKITKNGKHAIVIFRPEYKAEEVGMRIGVF